MLENEIALVTGASRGIGRAIALALGRAGAITLGTATTERGVAAIDEYFYTAGIKGRGILLDVTIPERIDSVVKEITETEGAPTILVNNAGITRDNLMLRMKDDEWQQILDTNLTSVFRLTRACLRAMTKARKGRIITIGSVVGTMGNPGQCNYAAAKAGILGFTKALAREVGGRGVTVNVVAPGFIDTDMTRALTENQRQGLLGMIPLGRLGTPDEVANAVVFLASPAASYITGETLHINGGMFMS